MPAVIALQAGAAGHLADAVLSSNVTQIITSAIWPVAAIILALIFKESIQELLSRIKGVSAFGLEAKLAERAEEARDQAEDIEVVSSPAAEALLDVAVSAPWRAVHQAWLLIQKTARGAAKGGYGDGTTTPERVRSLLQKNEVSSDTYQLAIVLAGLYHDMKKTPERIDAAAASNYVQAAAKLVSAIEQNR